jgi:AAHS family 4-hydroxybenzoate transporter-like MFS transporter
MMATPTPLAAHGGTVDVVAVIDGRPLGAFQRMTMVLVGLAIVMDGFDVQAMGLVAPAIVRDWGVARTALGPVFAASLVGMVFGSLVISTAADRLGRRPTLIAATTFFALAMLGTALCQTMGQLLAMRFITGLGLGGVMANAVALAGEYSPRHRRASIMMWVSCGFTAGGLLGGLVSAALIPWGGWRAVFVFGGVVPLVVALVMARFIPESMQFLVMRGRGERVAQWMRRVAPELAVTEQTRFIVHEPPKRGAPVAELFRGGLAVTTVLLWLINFANLLNLFFLANWLPTITADAGYSAQAAVLVGALLQAGGVVGTVAMGPLIDRLGFYRVLVPTFLCAVVSIAAIGRPGLAPVALVLAVGVSGLCIVGAQPALNAWAASIYPTPIRATGMGWSLGIGRIGSIVGPVLAGHLLGLKWSTESLFLAAALPALFSCAMVGVLWFVRMNMAGAGTVAPDPQLETSR